MPIVIVPFDDFMLLVPVSSFIFIKHEDAKIEFWLEPPGLFKWNIFKTIFETFASKPFWEVFSVFASKYISFPTSSTSDTKFLKVISPLFALNVKPFVIVTFSYLDLKSKLPEFVEISTLFSSRFVCSAVDI